MWRLGRGGRAGGPTAILLLLFLCMDAEASIFAAKQAGGADAGDAGNDAAKQAGGADAGDTGSDAQDGAAGNDESRGVRDMASLLLVGKMDGQLDTDVNTTDDDDVDTLLGEEEREALKKQRSPKGVLYVLILVVTIPGLLVVWYLASMAFVIIVPVGVGMFFKEKLRLSLLPGTFLFLVINQVMYEGVLAFNDPMFQSDTAWFKFRPNRLKLQISKALYLGNSVLLWVAVLWYVFQLVSYFSSDSYSASNCKGGGVFINPQRVFCMFASFTSQSIFQRVSGDNDMGAGAVMAARLIAALQLMFVMNNWVVFTKLWYNAEQWREDSHRNSTFWVIMLWTTGVGSLMAGSFTLGTAVSSVALFPSKSAITAFIFATWSIVCFCQFVHLYVSMHLYGVHHLKVGPYREKMGLSRLIGAWSGRLRSSHVPDFIRAALSMLLLCFACLAGQAIMGPSVHFMSSQTKPPTENIKPVGNPPVSSLSLARVSYMMANGVYYDDLDLICNDTDKTLSTCQMNTAIINNSSLDPNVRYSSLIDASRVVDYYGRPLGNPVRDEIYQVVREHRYAAGLSSAPECCEVDCPPSTFLKRLAFFQNATTDAQATVYSLYSVQEDGTTQRQITGLAFRGTEGKTDWRSNVATSSKPCNDICGGEGTEFHNGVLVQYLSIRGQIEAFFADRPDVFLKTAGGAEKVDHFIVTGHSLGGGLSTIAALDIMCHELFSGVADITRHIRFSALRVMTQPQLYQSKLPLARRVHMIGMFDWPVPVVDVVTAVPPDFLGFPPLLDDVHYIPIKRPRHAHLIYTHTTGLKSAMLESRCAETDSVGPGLDNPYNTTDFDRSVAAEQQLADRYYNSTGKQHQLVRPVVFSSALENLLVKVIPGAPSDLDSLRTVPRSPFYLSKPAFLPTLQLLSFYFLILALFPDFNVCDPDHKPTDLLTILTAPGILVPRSSVTGLIRFIPPLLAMYNVYQVFSPDELGIKPMYGLISNLVGTVPAFVFSAYRSWPLVSQYLSRQNGLQMLVYVLINFAMTGAFAMALYFVTFMASQMTGWEGNYEGFEQESCGCVYTRNGFELGQCRAYSSAAG